MTASQTKGIAVSVGQCFRQIFVCSDAEVKSTTNLILVSMLTKYFEQLRMFLFAVDMFSKLGNAWIN